MSINIVVISGNLTKDVDLKDIPGGSCVANFTVAVNEKYKDRQGEIKEEVAFILVTVFGKRAEACAGHLRKGSPVVVSGRLRQDRWQGKDDKPQSKTHVVASVVQFCDKERTGEHTQEQAQSQEEGGY